MYIILDLKAEEAEQIYLDSTDNKINWNFIMALKRAHECSQPWYKLLKLVPHGWGAPIEDPLA